MKAGNPSTFRLYALWGKWRNDLCQNDDGQDLVEYSLLLAFLILTAVALLHSTGTTLRSLLSTSVAATSSAITLSGS